MIAALNLGLLAWMKSEDEVLGSRNAATEDLDNLQGWFFLQSSYSDWEKSPIDIDFFWFFFTIYSFRCFKYDIQIECVEQIHVQNDKVGGKFLIQPSRAGLVLPSREFLFAIVKRINSKVGPTVFFRINKFSDAQSIHVCWCYMFGRGELGAGSSHITCRPICTRTIVCVGSHMTVLDDSMKTKPSKSSFDTTVLLGSFKHCD